MLRFRYAAVLLFVAAPAFAQDMPLSQVLIDGEGWKLNSPPEEMRLFPRFTVTRDGKSYQTVADEGAVYLLGTGDQKRKVADGIGRPTGIVFTPDGGTLLVADAAGKHVYAFRVEKDGSLTCKEGYYTLRLANGEKKASGAGPMTVDSAGRLYVTSTVGIQCFDPTGRLNGVLLNPGPEAPTAVAFGGPGRDELYAVFGGKLYVRKTKTKGLVTGEKPKQ